MICLLIGLGFPKTTGIANTLLRTVAVCGFVGLGFIGANGFMRKSKKIESILGIIIFLVCSLNNKIKSGDVAMFSRRFRNPIVFLITSILGTYILLNFSIFLKEYKDLSVIEIINMYGKKSIIILCVHNFIIEIIRLIDYKFFNDSLMAMRMMEGIILTVLIMVILTLAFPTVEKLFGKTPGMIVKGK